MSSYGCEIAGWNRGLAAAYGVDIFFSLFFLFFLFGLGLVTAFLFLFLHQKKFFYAEWRPGFRTGARG